MAIQDKFNKANVIYKITKDIDLGGGTLTIPEGCTLDFQGGSFSNGTIVGNNTAIQASLTKIFGLDVELSGTWNVSEAYPEWFGAKGDGITDDSICFIKAVEFKKPIKSCAKTYYINNPIHLKYKNDFIGTSNRSTKFVIGNNIDFLIIGDTNEWKDGTNSCTIKDFNVKGTTYNNYAIVCNGVDSSVKTSEIVYNRHCVIENIDVTYMGGFLKISDIFRVKVNNIGTWFVVNPIHIHGKCVQCEFNNITSNCDIDRNSVETQLRYIGIYNSLKQYADGNGFGESLKFNSCSFAGNYDIGVHDQTGGLLHVYNEMDIDGALEYGFVVLGEVVITNSWISPYSSENFVGVSIITGSPVTVRNNRIIIDKCKFWANNNIGNRIAIQIGNSNLASIEVQGVIITNNYFGGYSNGYDTFIKGYIAGGLRIKDNTFAVTCKSNNVVFIQNLKNGVISDNYSFNGTGIITATIYEASNICEIRNNYCEVSMSEAQISNTIKQIVHQNNKQSFDRILNFGYAKPSLSGYNLRPGSIVFNTNPFANNIIGWILTQGTGENLGWETINDVLARRGLSGASGNRPSLDKTVNAGAVYFDTTLGKPIWYNGSKWVDATGAEV